MVLPPYSGSGNTKRALRKQLNVPEDLVFNRATINSKRRTGFYAVYNNAQLH
jgi:hypothetical protein